MGGRFLDWTKVFLFHILTAIEGSAVFLLMVKLFRYTISELWKEIFFAVLFTSFVNYHLWHNELITAFTFLIQMGMLLLFNYFILRCNAIHALIVLCVGFGCYNLIQLAVLLLFDMTGLQLIQEIDGSNPTTTYKVQIVMAVTSWVLTYIISNKRIGFTFVHVASKHTVAPHKIWIGLSVISIFSILLALSIYMFLVNGGIHEWGLLVFQAISIGTILYLAYFKEKQIYQNQKQAYLVQRKYDR